VTASALDQPRRTGQRGLLLHRPITLGPRGLASRHLVTGYAPGQCNCQVVKLPFSFLPEFPKALIYMTHLVAASIGLYHFIGLA